MAFFLTLERISVIKDLGLSVSCDLQWGRHIAEIVSKSNKILCLIKRVCRDMNDTQTRKVLYCTLIRPRLEYCCSLWSPHTAKDRFLIENVQRQYFFNLWCHWVVFGNKRQNLLAHFRLLLQSCTSVVKVHFRQSIVNLRILVASGLEACFKIFNLFLKIWFLQNNSWQVA